jgi:hypothetical protein
MNGSNQYETKDKQAWPYASLLIFGFFGTGTPAGRKLARRTTLALGIFVFSAVMLGSGAAGPVPRGVWMLAIPGSVALIGWAYARYLHALDELSRLIQLKAFAFAYGAAMVLLWVGVAVGWSDAGPPDANPRLLILLVVCAEVLRGFALAYNARKYE